MVMVDCQCLSKMVRQLRKDSTIYGRDVSVADIKPHSSGESRQARNSIESGLAAVGALRLFLNFTYPCIDIF